MRVLFFIDWASEEVADVVGNGVVDVTGPVDISTVMAVDVVEVVMVEVVRPTWSGVVKAAIMVGAEVPETVSDGVAPESEIVGTGDVMSAGCLVGVVFPLTSGASVD